MRAGPHQHTERGSDRSRAASTFLTHRRQSVLSFVFSMAAEMPFRPDPFLEKFECSDAGASALSGLHNSCRERWPRIGSSSRRSKTSLRYPFAPYFIAVAPSAVANGGRAGILALTLLSVQGTTSRPVRSFRPHPMNGCHSAVCGRCRHRPGTGLPANFCRNLGCAGQDAGRLRPQNRCTA
jgi:hypothetical protein